MAATTCTINMSILPFLKGALPYTTIKPPIEPCRPLSLDALF